MAAISTMIAVGGLAVAGAGAYVANKNAEAQVAAQNEALAYQQKQNDLTAARQRRDAIRQARIARANATNSAATQGVLDSSGSIGGVGSISSQLKDNISFLDQWNQYSDLGSQALGRANVYGQRAQMAQTVSGLGMTVFGNSDILGGLASKVFKGSGSTKPVTGNAGI